MDKLASVLMQVFNCCFNQNELPTDWKFAIVTPLYKEKITDKQKCDNYLSINVLIPVSKIFEKLMLIK